MPDRANILERWSADLPLFTAERMPVITPNMTLKRVATVASSRVAGKNWIKSFDTGLPVLIEMPRSPWSNLHR